MYESDVLLVKVECMFVCLHVLTIKYSEITSIFNLASD
jgi:hypothetical protein